MPRNIWGGNTALNGIAKLASLRLMLPEPLGRQLEPHARLVEAGPGETVLGFGTRSTEVYVLLEGHVRAELYSPDGHEVILGDLGPGAIRSEEHPSELQSLILISYATLCLQNKHNHYIIPFN